jgi:hypothetical protein
VRLNVSAFLSLPNRCVDLDNYTANQFPSKGVQTKNSKAQRTVLIPIDDLFKIVLQWHNFVRSELGQDALSPPFT